jgi:guanidinopropionase
LNGPIFPESHAYPAEVGMTMLQLHEIQRDGIPAAVETVRRVIGDGPAYLTFDVDVLTLGEAPGVANPAAGGLTTNEVFQFLRGFRGLDIVGADIVCYVPHYDPTYITAINISGIMHDLVTLLAETVGVALTPQPPLPTVEERG